MAAPMFFVAIQFQSILIASIFFKFTRSVSNILLQVSHLFLKLFCLVACLLSRRSCVAKNAISTCHTQAPYGMRVQLLQNVNSRRKCIVFFYWFRLGEQSTAFGPLLPSALFYALEAHSKINTQAKHTEHPPFEHIVFSQVWGTES